MWNDKHPILRRTLPAYLAMSVALPLLQGCGAAVVTGIVVGAAVLHDRRDRETVLADQKIELQAVRIALGDPDVSGDCRVATTSYNLVALLTGQCGEQASAERFAERISQLAKVKRVVDEITIGPRASVARESEDALVTSRAKFAITQVGLKGFDATRVKVVTESGVVYLMGLVSGEEADAVVEQVRYVPGVQRVVKVFEYTQPAPT